MVGHFAETWVTHIALAINPDLGSLILPQDLIYQKLGFWDFPGGAVVKNPPTDAGDTGSSPGLGRSHMPRSN